MSERKEGPRVHDPGFEKGRTPDILFWSPGYHTTKLNASAYGDSIDGILDRWQDAIDGPMPQMHLMLNMMPAPWMIPRRYAADREYRTLSNEYHKNLAILGSAKKYDFVKGVVDFFSIELPFNGKPGSATAHGDAVHVSDPRILSIAAHIVIETFCDSHEALVVRESVEA